MHDGETKWVVVLEAAVTVDDSFIHRLLQILSDAKAVALHCPERYAIQMEMSAVGQADALLGALTRWQSAHRAIDQAQSEVVRAEVLSWEEFERECLRAYGLGDLSAGRWRFGVSVAAVN